MPSIFISGATAGIGYETAKLFAAKGWSLAIGARRQDRLRAIAQELIDLGAKDVFHHALDVQSGASIQTFVTQLMARWYAAPDVIFNNAGLALGVDTVAEIKPETWETVFRTNVFGVFDLTRQMLPSMIARRSGHIIMMGSIAGHVVYEKGSAYTASKHALRALTKTLRLELNGTGIRVTTIDPGMVETEFSVVRLGDEDRAKDVYKGMTPLTGKDIAECVVFSAERPVHVNIDEIIIMPTDQAAVHKVCRRS